MQEPGGEMILLRFAKYRQGVNLPNLVALKKNGSAQTQYVIQLILAVQLLRVFIDTGSHTEFVL
jgi:hypothetical protein